MIGMRGVTACSMIDGRQLDTQWNLYGILGKAINKKGIPSNIQNQNCWTVKAVIALPQVWTLEGSDKPQMKISLLLDLGWQRVNRRQG